MSAERLTPDEVDPAQVEDLKGKYIGQDEGIELLTAPVYYKYEWRCLANVRGMLCVIVVNLHRKD